jgi:predicted nuclease with TOPRIM domain
MPYAGPPRQLPPNVGAANEATSDLIRKFQETDEHRRALLDQVQSLKTELKNREESLRLVSREVEDTTRYVKRTRDEFHQWQAEMDELRERVRKLEDYRATLKPLLDEAINQLDLDKTPAKSIQRYQPGK